MLLVNMDSEKSCFVEKQDLRVWGGEPDPRHWLF